MNLIIRKGSIVKVVRKGSIHYGNLGVADGSFRELGQSKLYRVTMGNGDVVRFSRSDVKIINTKKNKNLKKRVKFLESLVLSLYEKI